MDLNDFFDNAICALTAWHYTAGWGNLFTVSVASIAVVSSVVVSRITLRRNAAQFKQGRLDERRDKLRTEVIELISALSERSSQSEIVTQRIRELGSADLQTMHQRIKVIFSENLWASYRRATGHALAVLMLTEDQKATEATGIILDGLDRQRHLFEAAATPSTTFSVDGHEVDRLSNAITAAAEQLKGYALRELGVPTYDAQGHLLNKRELLPPN